MADPQNAESQSSSLHDRLPRRIPLAGVVFATVAAAGVAVALFSQRTPTQALAGDDSANGVTVAQANPAKEAPKTPAAAGSKKKPAEAASEHPFPNRAPVPENIFDGGKGWLNASGDIQLKDLKGKVVVLDFWTYCCINCMHVLPDLAFLEKKYGSDLVVIGVHSAKFDNEKDTENIRRAIQRYNIEHPVVNDAEMHIWRKFGVNAWPTIVVMDAEGNYCGHASGEGKRELLDAVVGNLIKHHIATNTLDRTPLRFDLERAKMPPMPLKFPGKVLADEAGGRLFIADTNHNRIVVASFDGKLLDVIGSGAIGATDGGYAEAAFDHPQGMALVDETLYVADTENHLLRAVDLKAKKVATLAGTGQQDRERTQGGPLRETALNSPWDLHPHEGLLYIAMAGPHQIWRHRIGSKTINAYAGSGREDVRNGDLEKSAFAQPSGLASDGKALYIADSEGSAIRRLPFSKSNPVTTTIAGTHDLPNGQSLFAFGDVDGKGDEARLQHPIGVAYHDGAVYVADSYNHKIRKITLGKGDEGTTTTFLGESKAGTTVDPPRFNEPHGLAIAGGKMYVADTNNQRIVVVDLATRKGAEFVVAGLEPPKPKASTDDPVAPGSKATSVGLQKLAAGATVTLEFPIMLPEDYKLNPLAPVTVRVTAEGDQSLIAADQLAKRLECRVADETATIELPLAAKEGTGTFQVALSFSYCREGKGGVCKLGSSRWKVPVSVSEAGTAKSITLPSAIE